MFHHFNRLVENESGYKVKMLRSDNGAKSTSDNFEKICRVANIKY